MTPSDTPTPRTDTLMGQLGMENMPWKARAKSLFEHARQLERDLATAQRELEQARADSRRMDYLLARGKPQGDAWAGKPYPLYVAQDKHSSCDDRYISTEAIYDRAAIDAAMEAIP
jgi:hypothetical protein